MKLLIKTILAGGIILNGMYSQAGVIVLGNPSKIEEFKNYLQEHPETQSLTDQIITDKIQKGDSS